MFTYYDKRFDLISVTKLFIFITLKRLNVLFHTTNVIPNNA